MALLQRFLLYLPHEIGTFFATTSREVEARQIQIAFLASTKNLMAGILAAMLTAFGVWTIPSRAANEPLAPFLLLWTAALLCILVRGIWLTEKFNRAGASGDTLIHLGRRLAGNGFMAGSLWGSSSFLLLVLGDIQQASVLISMIGLVIMGGAGAQAQYGRLVTAFVSATTMFFVCGMAINPDIPPFMLVGFILYGVVALGFAAEQKISVQEVIELNLQNERLLREARAAMEALASAKNVAEKANSAKTRFLAATSHDLRQPVHALSLYIAHLHSCRDQREFMETLRMADSAMRAMKDLLDAVLDLSRISLGTFIPSVSSFDLGNILQRVDLRLRPLADAKNIALVIDDFKGSTRSDPVLLERILCNVVSNAISYTAMGRITMRIRQRRQCISIQVVDTGIGIPKHEQVQVFEEFYQLQNPERDREKGLGLGLAIVAQLSALLSHPIALRSRVGRGTIFRINLPLSTDIVETIPARRMSEQYDLSNCLVLVIDDDRLGLDSIVRTLKDMGCRITAASGGAEALEAIEGEGEVPDMIVTDYRLRLGETGIDVIRMLRQAMQGDAAAQPAIPALIISGDTSPEEVAAMTQAGLPMLYKPVDPGLLRATIHTLLATYARDLRAPVEGES